MAIDSIRNPFATRTLCAMAVLVALLAGGCSGSSSKASPDSDATAVSQSNQPDRPDSPDQASGDVPTLTLSTSAPEVAQGQPVTLSWNTTAAESCTASGGWSGEMGASGSQSSGSLAQGTTFSLSCTGPGGSVLQMISVAVIGPVQLAWVAPDENVDGSALTDLAGYRIYYGDGSRSYSDMVEVNAPTVTSHTLSLASGDYYVAMTALDGEGNESGYSNEVIKTAL